MTIAVHLGFTPADQMLERLRELIADHGITLTQGMEAPSDASYQILVSGRPSEALLKASDQLNTLIIPWAGLPRFHRVMIESIPNLAVHNLHHNGAATAEMALALMMSAAKRVVPLDQALRRGDWTARYQPSECLEFEGSHALVLGYGAIGKRVARACKALAMQVSVIRRNTGDAEAGELAPDRVIALSDDAREPSAILRELLPSCDVVMVCLPATPETDGLIGAEELAQLPNHAVVVNVGRGPIIDELAFFEALRDRKLGAAGIDTWYVYPRSEEERANFHGSQYPFHELPNVVLSPHRGGHTTRTEHQRAEHLATLLLQAARGEAMDNRVDISAGY